MKTPYYLIDKSRLQANMEKIAWLREASGAKSLLALKCFATWSVFDFMAQYMDGSTSSSLYEVKLGYEKFGGETHAYSVAYDDDEIAEVLANSDKIIFNSIGQLDRFDAASAGHTRGLRVNPGVSTSEFDLADPARPFSRLGEHDPAQIAAVADRVTGLMFHNNCENDDFDRFADMLTLIEKAEAVADAAVGGPGNQLKSGLGDPGAFLFGNVPEMLPQRLHVDAPEVESLTAAEYSHRNLADLGGGKNEFNVLGRLFERLQQRVEGVLGQHVDLVQEVHLGPAGGAQGDPRQQVAHVVDLVVGGRIQLMQVEGGTCVHGSTGLTLAAGFAVLDSRAVQGLGQDPCGRRLPGSAGAAE